MHTVVVENRIGETCHQKNVISATGHHLRELGHDFWKSIAIPERRMAVHGRRDDEAPIWSREGGFVHCGKDILEDGHNTVGDGTSFGRTSEKIRQAGQKAHVGVGAN